MDGGGACQSDRRERAGRLLLDRRFRTPPYGHVRTVPYVHASSKSPHMKQASNLSAADWSRAALDAIADGGVEQVTVEGLARRLGVTKGSFYWHFADRSALVASALELWEQLGTQDIIDQLQQVRDPKAQLRALFATAFGDLVDGPADAALMARIDDPVVGPAVRRVTAARVAFLEEIYRKLGLSPARAAARACIAYSTYVGHLQVRRSLLGDQLTTMQSTSYLRQVIEVLTADVP